MYSEWLHPTGSVAEFKPNRALQSETRPEPAERVHPTGGLVENNQVWISSNARKRRRRAAGATILRVRRSQNPFSCKSQADRQLALHAPGQGGNQIVRTLSITGNSPRLPECKSFLKFPKLSDPSPSCGSRGQHLRPVGTRKPRYLGSSLFSLCLNRAYHR